MFFRQILHRDLGCASYLLADGGEAVVVDPRWDIDEYLRIAAQEKLRIAHVIDTHEHADHVSGRARLVAATGARAHRPRRADGSGDEPGTVAAGEEIIVGALRLTALGTPGHRPEHLAFAIADTSRGEEPWMLLSGDSLLVGDVARPDLAYEPAEGAHALHETLTQLLSELPDGVELWPAHVGGSLCGGAGLSHKTSSTIGYERRHNRPLSLDRDAFVQTVTASLPSRPPNIERIVGLNRPAEQPFPGEPPALQSGALVELCDRGVTVLDSRTPDEFDAGHLTGAINLPLASAGLGTRAGWALDPEQPLVIIASDKRAGAQTASTLQAVGFWNLTGIAVADTDAWWAAGLTVSHSLAWDIERLAGGLRDEEVALVDARELAEWLAGHVRGSVHLPLVRLPEIATLPRAREGRVTAVACAAGARAAFAASLLRRVGHDDVVRVAGGGIGDLPACGISLAVGED
ncbi:MAG TPA: MBL fold metallo-hydrolase [Solirubrobacteraceae bacterium]|nr:MBL fold metallo-hydrolase [Solirubrobacteraceae bacterium]